MKKYTLFFILILLSVISGYGQKALKSSVYEWENLPVKKTSSGEERVFFKSPTRSLDMFDVKTVTLNPGKAFRSYQVEKGSDELLIIKDGTIDIRVNDESKSLPEGSVIVASAGDDVSISNNQGLSASYYSIKFKPDPDKEQSKGKTIMPPLFIDWNKVEFVPSEKGGRRGVMQEQRSALKELEIHVTTLKEGLPSHAAHVHADEEIILVRKGFVEETIKGEPFRLGPGSIIFLTDDDPHGISNAGKGECEYYAIRWLTE